MFAALSAMNKKVLFNGVFTTTSASSPVTSSLRTCVRGGTLTFDTVTTDSGTPQYSKNAAAYANITEGMTLALAKGDTLQVKAVLPTAAQTAAWIMRRTFGGVITESVVLTKS